MGAEPQDRPHPSAPRDPAGAVWSAGVVVADHRLLEVLGSGGSGQVWRALHLPTGGERAIKTLTHGASPEEVARFAREVGALAQLDGHPHVVRVHTAGVAGGRPYLVLDLARGDLSARLKAGPLPAEEVRRVALQLGAGLAHVHAHGLLHRDLKPQNVLFAEDGRALLTDFGLVRGPSRSSLTETGAILGTPSYMAPEQVRGEPLDERTDVYGLGAVLYHALSGCPPFSGSTIAVLHAILEGPPPLAPGLDRDLAAVCERAMASTPEDRYASAAEFVRALRRESGAGSRAARPLGVALVAAAACLALGLWSWSAGRVSPPPSAPGSGDRPGPSVESQTPEEALEALEARLDALPIDGLPAPEGPLWSGLPALESFPRRQPKLGLRCFLGLARDRQAHGWFLLAEHVGSLPGFVPVELAREAALGRGTRLGSQACAVALADRVDDERRAAELYAQALGLDPPPLELSSAPGGFAARAKDRLVELCAADPRGFPVPVDDVLRFAQERFLVAAPEARAALEVQWLRLGEHCLERLIEALPAPKVDPGAPQLDHGMLARSAGLNALELRDYPQAAAWSVTAATADPPAPQGWIALGSLLEDPDALASLGLSPARSSALRRALLERARSAGWFRGYEYLGNFYREGAPDLLIAP
ncbi:MAG: protein kinase, partial [Planctomycetes bacterium]|nr:protein kinase [Planctomycetota bacterium]